MMNEYFGIQYCVSELLSDSDYPYRSTYNRAAIVEEMKSSIEDSLPPNSICSRAEVFITGRRKWLSILMIASNVVSDVNVSLVEEGYISSLGFTILRVISAFDMNGLENAWRYEDPRGTI